MTDQLRGTAFRIFRSLLREWDRNTVEDIRIEMTQGAVVTADEVQDTLDELEKSGYVEEFSPGRWRVTAQGRALERSLLGLPR